MSPPLLLLCVDEDDNYLTWLLLSGLMLEMRKLIVGILKSTHDSLSAFELCN
ncbi:hypothetical protein FB106_1157 [Synechococcus sp. Ace-Pa]|nr:hypothetical protein FB106_1157 [Synechococcus sp. Ace-Pa]